jgi:hypothetical protein
MDSQTADPEILERPERLHAVKRVRGNLFFAERVALDTVRFVFRLLMFHFPPLLNP